MCFCTCGCVAVNVGYCAAHLHITRIVTNGRFYCKCVCVFTVSKGVLIAACKGNLGPVSVSTGVFPLVGIGCSAADCRNFYLAGIAVLDLKLCSGFVFNSELEGILFACAYSLFAGYSVACGICDLIGCKECI